MAWHYQAAKVFKSRADKSRACDDCHKPMLAMMLYAKDKDDPSQGWECGACIADRICELERFAALEAATLVSPTDWASDRGVFLKVERSRMLNEWRWTVAPDSPLSEACKAAFLAYLGTLHRMTIDSTPDVWAWPETPALDYAEGS